MTRPPFPSPPPLSERQNYLNRLIGVFSKWFFSFQVVEPIMTYTGSEDWCSPAELRLESLDGLNRCECEDYPTTTP